MSCTASSRCLMRTSRHRKVITGCFVQFALVDYKSQPQWIRIITTNVRSRQVETVIPRWLLANNNRIQARSCRIDSTVAFFGDSVVCHIQSRRCWIVGLEIETYVCLWQWCIFHSRMTPKKTMPLLCGALFCRVGERVCRVYISYDCILYCTYRGVCVCVRLCVHRLNCQSSGEQVGGAFRVEPCCFAEVGSVHSQVGRRQLLARSPARPPAGPTLLCRPGEEGPGTRQPICGRSLRR